MYSCKQLTDSQMQKLMIKFAHIASSLWAVIGQYVHSLEIHKVPRDSGFFDTQSPYFEIKEKN